MSPCCYELRWVRSDPVSDPYGLCTHIFFMWRPSQIFILFHPATTFLEQCLRSLVLRLTSPLPVPDVRLSQVPGPGWSWSLTRGGSSPGSTLAVTIQSSEERWTKERWEKGQNDRLCWSFFFNECVEYLHSGFQEFSTRPISTRTNGKGDKCF